MIKKTLFIQNRPEVVRVPDQRQAGQSIVIIALALVGLLAFVGIAVDVGFVFARNTQLQAAVDSAALAGVSELVANPLDPTNANVKATQFLATNGFDITVDIPANNQLGLGDTLGTNALGEIQYELTATWPVELFFLQLVGQDAVTLTRDAVAGVFPMADIYASRRVEEGILGTSNQAIFGPSICTSYGDPFSPTNSAWAPGFYTYNYRILIPDGYENQHDVVRVEMFDPDSINQTGQTFNVQHTTLAQTLGGMPLFETMNCPNNDQHQPCLINTQERNISGVNLDQINPYWFIRLDENRGSGGGNGDGSCGTPSSYTPRYNTQTTYELFYWAQNPDGTVRRVPLATYTGQVDDGVRDSGGHDTDMRWVTPGSSLNTPDQTVIVPTDCGSPNGGDYDATTCPTGSAAGPGSGFEVSISQDLTDILTDPGSGNRYLYLDVTAISGSSENGFELWAGPNTYINDVPSEANSRNLYILNNRGGHLSKGVTVFGMGRLPMNSNENNRLDIPLIWVPPDFAGETVYISMFDSDSGAAPPIDFFFDSIARSDWSVTFAPPGPHSCYPGSCNNQWVNPAYEVIVPGDTSNCDYTNPNPIDCTPFYGGRLVTSYDGGGGDTYVWQIRLSGNPYLVK